MADLVKTYTTHISQSASNPPTCFALPGAKGGNRAWMPCELDITVKVYSDYAVYMDMTGTISKSTILSADYPVVMIANAKDWDWSYSGGSIVIPSGSGTIASATIYVESDKVFTWNINSTNVYIGQLTDFGASGSGTDGVVYISGTGTYSVDTPAYPDPVGIVVPGFLEYLGYYPWARMIDATFKSCDRSGGAVQRNISGSWTMRKNTKQGTVADTVFYRTNSTWAKCPKIGAE